MYRPLSAITLPSLTSITAPVTQTVSNAASTVDSVVNSANAAVRAANSSIAEMQALLPKLGVAVNTVYTLGVNANALVSKLNQVNFKNSEAEADKALKDVQSGMTALKWASVAAIGCAGYWAYSKWRNK